MINQQQLNQLYAQKLLETGSHDQAILKACWVAYQQGLTDANIENNKPMFEHGNSAYRKFNKDDNRPSL